MCASVEKCTSCNYILPSTVKEQWQLRYKAKSGNAQFKRFHIFHPEDGKQECH
jgi:hypothetical protein